VPLGGGGPQAQAPTAHGAAAATTFSAGARLWRSTSFRLTVGYAGLFIVSSLLLVGFIYVATAGFMNSQINQVIVADTEGLRERFRDDGLPGLIGGIRERVAGDPASTAIYLLASPTLQPLAGNLSAWPTSIELNGSWYEGAFEHNGRASIVRFHDVLLPGRLRLLVGRDVRDRVEVQSLIFNALMWAIGLTTVLAIAGGLIFRRTLDRRIEVINATAGAIVKGDLSQRIPTAGTGDEFDQLSATLNRMLDQIEQLMDGVSEVSNAIAHDLRTPLARLRNSLEEMTAGRLERAAWPAAIERAIAELDGLLDTFNALLRIAEVESGARRSAFDVVALDPLLRDAADLYAALAEERDLTISIAVDPAAKVLGDRHLLSQAIANLLDNAIKHSHAGGRIDLSARPADNGIEIVVADNGPGIPDVERANVTRRYYRLERSRGTPGSGLGLSLVAAVVKLHGGTLALDDNRPGLRVTMRMPDTKTPDVI
jgi:signal transduction histidine kinase